MYLLGPMKTKCKIGNHGHIVDTERALSFAASYRQPGFNSLELSLFWSNLYFRFLYNQCSGLYLGDYSGARQWPRMFI
jgi:hypothetical protein